MKEFLEETQIIDFKNEEVLSLAQKLAKDCKSDEEIAKNCFLYVRDNIHHSGDFKDEITTYKASDVLKYKTGWCYAKSHLLAALLRANGLIIEKNLLLDEIIILENKIKKLEEKLLAKEEERQETNNLRQKIRIDEDGEIIKNKDQIRAKNISKSVEFYS